MLTWVVIFLGIALVSAVLAFSGVTAAITKIAKVVLAIFVVLLTGASILYFTGTQFALFNWTMVFLAVAVISAIIAYSGVAAAFTDVAKVLFFIFLILMLSSLVMRWVGV